MRALQDLVVGRDRQCSLKATAALRLVMVEGSHEARDIRDLEVIRRPFALAARMHIRIGEARRPRQIPTRIDTLEIHGEPLEAIRQLHRDWVAIDTPGLLEVGELRHLHTVEPDLPTGAPGAQRRRLPVVLDKAHVVRGCVDANGSQ